MLADGLHDVPAGKVAAVVTYLEMRQQPAIQPRSFPTGWTFARIEGPGIDWYRDIFRRVGGDWLWFSRLRLDDAALSAILDDPDIAIWTLRKDGADHALLELDWTVTGACELAFFGLTSGLMGQGAGRALMDAAIAEAWRRPITRFHVHTCTLDSPHALAFYMRSGFTPMRQQIEIADDPRLTGKLPRDAGAHVPIFNPSSTD